MSAFGFEDRTVRTTIMGAKLTMKATPLPNNKKAGFLAKAGLCSLGPKRG